MADKKLVFPAILLSVIILIPVGGFGTDLATGGGGCSDSTPSPCWKLVQHSTLAPNCRITPPAASCTTSPIAFSPSYSVKPSAWVNQNASSTTNNMFIQNNQNSQYSFYTFFAGEPGTGLGTTWTSFPAAPTELFTGSDLRVFGTLYKTITFCINLVTPSSNAGAYLTIYASPDQVTWSELAGGALRILVDGTLGTGVLCSAFNIPATIVGDYFAVYGAQGGGVGDNPSFGHMDVQTSQALTIQLSVPCTPLVSALSTTQITLKEVCGTLPTNGAAQTFYFNWWTGIAG